MDAPEVRTRKTGWGCIRGAEGENSAASLGHRPRLGESAIGGSVVVGVGVHHEHTWPPTRRVSARSSASSGWTRGTTHGRSGGRVPNTRIVAQGQCKRWRGDLPLGAHRAPPVLSNARSTSFSITSA
jgi:hypothetical protein